MKTIWPLLAYSFLISRIMILILLSSSITFANSIKDSGDAQLKQMESQLQQLNHKNNLIDMKNDHQDREIQMLKTLVFKILDKESNNDNAKIVTVAHENILNNERIMQKRPVRLLPSYVKTKEKKPIVGPPSSCKDLNDMGHTVNGIYMVSKTNSSNSIPNRSEMLPLRAVFCDFQVIGENSPSSPPPPPVKESNLGFLGLKSAEYGIHFYAQMSDTKSVPGKGVLIFNRMISNVGGGMNFKSGVFTAPRAGVYTFSFSITKHAFVFEYLEVSLRLNGVRVGHSVAGSGLISAPVTLQSILKLKKKDRVDLWKSQGEIHKECNGYCHHFTGSLTEDLIE